MVPDGIHPIVTGRVESFAPESVTEYEHLEISVIAPDGRLLARVSTNYNPRGIEINPRNPFHYATYATRLPLVPPPGAKIRVAVAWD